MKNKNLNEEINRIKSLFTEERLYGNLCEQGISNALPGNTKKPTQMSYTWDTDVKDSETVKNTDLFTTAQGVDPYGFYTGEGKFDYHTILDILAISALAIPGWGYAISMGIEGLNAIGYAIEGDMFGLGLTALFALLPGAAVLRKPLTKNKTLVKKLDKFFAEILEKGGKVNPKEFDDGLKKILGEKYYKANKALIDEYINNINKLVTKEGLEIMTKLLKYKPHIFTRFTKTKKILEKYMSKNGNDLMTAYAAYLKDLALIEFRTGASIYGGLMLLINQWENIFGEVKNYYGVEKQDLFKEYEIPKGSGKKYIVICKEDGCGWYDINCNKLSQIEDNYDIFMKHAEYRLNMGDDYDKFVSKYCKKTKIGDPTNWMKY
jgi:hypothetical protein